MPFLRAIQRSRNAFQSFSDATAADSRSRADKSWRTALSSAVGEKSISLETVYMRSEIVAPPSRRLSCARPAHTCEGKMPSRQPAWMPALPQLKADNRKLKADFTLLPLRLPSSPALPGVQIRPDP